MFSAVTSFGCQSLYCVGAYYLCFFHFYASTRDAFIVRSCFISISLIMSVAAVINSVFFIIIFVSFQWTTVVRISIVAILYLLVCKYSCCTCFLFSFMSDTSFTEGELHKVLLTL